MFDEFDDTDVHLKDDESSSDEDAPKSMGFGKVRAKQALLSLHFNRNYY